MNITQLTVFALFFYFIFFVAVIHFTRAISRRAWGAVAGGLAVALVGIAIEWKCEALGFWRYPYSSSPIGPPIIYPALLMQFAVLALLGWRATRRWGRRGLTIFVLAVTGIGGIRDYSYSRFYPGLMTLKPGLPTLCVDLLCWSGLTILAMAVMYKIAGPSTRDPLARSPRPGIPA